MKKIINSLAILSIIISLAGCASSKEPTGVWVNRDKFQAQHFKKIFVVAVTADVSVRVRMEKALAGALESKGFEVVKSVDVIPPSLDKPEKPPIDSVVAQVKKTGCDAVFVAVLVKKEELVQYTPGNTTFSWMGNVTGYYDFMYSTVTRPGYFTDDKSFIVQSNLYDAATESILVSVVSPVSNPSSMDDFTNDYMKTLASQLKKAKINKK
ncbi:hypothetical protein [Paraflavitalea sp. CAU 1676]|uniref:hypothetical protein n=1 Tax=Paraflavitalea sp. CAU 1676 TaxID=3032598 RepID=UPI0023D9A564|nr:hypothetical protein [Paraflavitalea sp. CAU 1676]MDF2190650.1 hypothetical protein [Paraflavitalea sp. CAU 1676]